MSANWQQWRWHGIILHDIKICFHDTKRRQTWIQRQLREAALYYHRHPKPGQDRGHADQATDQPVRPVDGVFAGRRLRLRRNRRRSGEASTLTARANLVGVITNGTAVLGLGAIGPLAAKPVMEGKGVLFKKFANIDVFDLEIDERDPDKLIDTIASLEPTFGGINLEDIKAPECFYIEKKLRERMKIPVFHDDQHGTAIVVGAAVLNGLHLIGKDLNNGQDRHLGRRRRRARLSRPAGHARRPGREHLGHRHQGPGL